MEAIAHCPRPENKEGLMRFLGTAGYYRRFFSNFATVAELLTQFLSKKVQLKLIVVASDVAVGAMLSQEDDEGV